MEKYGSLTKGQENLLNVERVYKDTGINNIVYSLEITNEVDDEHIISAIKKLVENINLFQIWINDEKKQYISSNKEANIKIENFMSISDYSKWLEVWKTQSIFSYDASLYEFVIVHSEDNNVYILLKMHHILCDLETLYSILELLMNSINQKAINISKYSTFITDMKKRHLIQSHVNKKFWEKRFVSYCGCNLLSVKPKEIDTNIITFGFDKLSYENVKQFLKKHEVSFYQLYISALLYVKKLYTQTNSVAVAIGTGRGKSEGETKLGPYTKILPLITLINEEQDVSEYVSFIKESMVLVNKESETSISELLNKFEISEFNSLMDISCIEYTKHKYDDTIKNICINERTNVLTIGVRSENIFTANVVYEYQKNNMKLQEVINLHELIVHLMNQFVLKDEQQLKTVSLIPDSHKEKIDKLYIEADISFNNIIEMFRHRVAEEPEHVAVKDWERQLTYQELDEVSNKFANILYKYGVRKGQIVASSMSGCDAVATILGIMKIGAVYLPIDKNYPIERINYILEDSLAKLYVTKEKIKKRLIRDNIKFDEDLIVAIDNVKANVKNQESKVRIGAKDAAYVIYTSGSTGNPKGVVIGHRSVVNMADAFRKSFDITNDDVIQQFASHSFDASILEIFGAILNGATALLLDDNTKKNPYKLQDLWDKENVTYAIIPPVYMSALNHKRSTTLRTLMTAGEEASWNFIKDWKNKTNYVNGYGPSEGTVWSTTWFYDDDTDTNSKVPIGKPIQNIRCAVVQGGRSCGFGIPGELVIFGECLAIGYLNNSALTNAKFCLFPEVGCIGYKTGDVVKWLSDGNLQFLSRNDNQVKVRGFRIELGEIITKIKAIDGVKDCYVTVRKEDGEKEIVAFVKCEKGITEQSLSEQMQEELPEYMVPAYIQLISEIPITINGKVDEKKLLRDFKINEFDENLGDNEYKENEALLVEIYGEVLRRKNINIKSNFYQLGGDSIKAIRIVSKLRERGYAIEIGDILSRRPIEEIAFGLVQDSSLLDDGEDRVLQDEDIILSPIQKFFFEKNLLVLDHFNQCVLLHSKDKLNVENVKNAYSEVVNVHRQLQVYFKDGESQNIIKSKTKFTFNCFDLSTSDDFDSDLQDICQNAHENFMIDCNPLSSITVIQSSQGDYIFFCAHHLVVDGISWRVIVEDFENAYKQLQEGNKVKLPRVYTEFFEWTEMINSKADEIVEEEKEYWDDVMKNLQSANIQSDYVPSLDSKHYVATVDAEDTKMLIEGIGQKLQATISEVFTACLVEAISEEAPAKVAIMNESHGRETELFNADLGRTVGWFTTFYPEILEKTGNVLKTLKSVVQMHKNVSNKGFGYLLYREKNRESINLEPQIVLNYMGDMTNLAHEFEVSLKNTGNRNAEANETFYPVIITGNYINGIIQFDFSINENYYLCNQFDEISQRFIQKIKECIELLCDDYALESENNCYELVVEKEYDLTSMQENFLYNKMNDKEDNYFVQVLVQSEIDLEDRKVRSVMQELSNIYETLRMNYLYSEIEKPKAVQYKFKAIDFEVASLSSVDSDDFKKLLEDDKKREIDLEKDNLLRTKLIHLSNKKCIILWSFNHILMDGWCLNILMDSFRKLYESNCNEDTIRKIMNEKGQYSEYVEYLQSLDMKKQFSYWQRVLKGYDAVNVILPEKKGVGEARFSLESIQLKDSIENNILKVTQKMQSSMGSFLEAVWGIVLGIYSLSNDVVFGKVTFGRNKPISGIENIVGLFINTIPMRVRTNDKMSFKQLVKNITRESRLSEKNSDISISELNQIESNLVRSLMSIDLFEENQTNDSLGLKHLKTIEQTNYDLNLSIVKRNKIYLEMIYNENKYEKNTIYAILEHYMYLLEQFSNNPDAMIGDVRMVDESEEDIILNKFNQAIDVSHIKENGIYEVFERIAKENQDNSAIHFRNEILTYRELKDKVDYLAEYLVKRGVKKGEIVISLFERGSKVVISMLALFKIGAIYLPLDISHPSERIIFIAEDSNAVAILTTDEVANRKQLENSSVETILFPEHMEQPKGDIVCSVEREDPAYIIYTSGSTGKPKGVVVKNFGVLNMALEMKSEFGFGNDEVVQQFASVAFDASILEIMTAILNGYPLVIIPEEYKLDPNAVVDIWNEKGVTFGVLPPVFVGEIEVERVRTLRFLKTAGEESNWNIINKWKNRVKYANGYGPTEATVWTTTWFYDDKIKDGESIPIGKPVRNVQCYIMQKNRLVGIGVPGELCVGGVSLAKEYLHNKEMTDSKFTQNVFRSGERMYHTGDYARWTEDGNIEFLGRIDKQVKIRGNRIELGEINNVIQKNAGIKESCVVVKKVNNEKTICAYIVENSEVSISELKKEIMATLPSYMLPSYFVKIDKIPINLSGKVNEKLLPDVEQKENSNQEREMSSRELEVAKVFQTVLDNPNIGLYDGFFECGGHSIKALRAVNMLAGVVGVRVPIHYLFDYSTVEKLAAKIDEMVNTQKKADVVAENIKQELKDMSNGLQIATDTQKSLFALQEISCESTAYNITAVFKVTGDVDIERLKDAVCQVINKHDAFKVNFDVSDADVIFTIKDRMDLSIDVINTDLRINDFVQTIVKPFDLKDDDLIRVKMVRNSLMETFMIFDSHHTVCDGTSYAVLVQDIMDCYQGKTVNECKVSYKEEVAKQILLEREADMDYWKKALGEKVEYLKLETDYPRCSRNDYEGEQIKEVLDASLVQIIDNYCSERNITQYMFFMAVYHLLMYKKSKNDEVIVGTPINARTGENDDRVVGMFVNTLPIKTEFSRLKTFRNLVEEVRTAILNLLGNKNTSLNRLVDMTNANTDYTRNPLFDVVLVYNDSSEMAVSGNGITASTVPFESNVAVFDITLDISGGSKDVYLRWEYKRNLYSKSTILQFNDEYVQLIKDCLADDLCIINPDKNAGDKHDIVKSAFESILNKKDLDFTKSFIELGGDSIKAIRIVSKLRKENIECQPGDILKAIKLTDVFPENEEAEKSSDKVSDITVTEGEQDYRQVREIFENALNTKLEDLDKSFLELGGDSIKAIRIISKMRKLGIEYTAKEILSSKTMNEVFQKISGVKLTEEAAVTDENFVECNVPIIHKFFEQGMYNENYFNQANIYKLKQKYTLEEFEKCFSMLVKKHPVFTYNYVKVNDKILVKKNNNKGYELQIFDNKLASTDFIEAKCKEIQRSFRIEESPLLKAGIFYVEDGCLLFVCAHHLTIDGYSWNVLVDDLLTLLHGNGIDTDIGSEDMSYLEWNKALVTYSKSPEFAIEKSYWNSVVEKIEDGFITAKGAPHEVKDFEQKYIKIESNIVARIFELCSASNDIEINDVLLTCFGMALNAVFKKKLVAINLEGHGREEFSQDVLIGDTIGWFTSVFPVIVEVNDDNVIQNINYVKESLHKIPNKGVGFGILKYVSNEVKYAMEPDIAFNYLGDVSLKDNMCVNDLYDFGKTIDEKNYLWSELNINCYVEKDELNIYCDYNRVKIGDQDVQLMLENMADFIRQAVSGESDSHYSATESRSIESSDIQKNEIELPLTAMQKGMFFHSIANNESTEYCTQTTIKLIGSSVNYVSLKKAIEFLSIKYSALTMSVKYNQNHEMMQVLNIGRHIEVDYIDITKEECDVQQYIKDYQQKQLSRGFNLEEGKLFVVTLIKASNSNGYMLLHFHHALLDGWSLPTLLAAIIENYNFINNLELDKLYEKMREGDPYIEYIKHVSGLSKPIALEYWKNILKDYNNEATFDAIKTNSMDSDVIGDDVDMEIELDKSLCEQLRAFSNKHNVTKNIIFETVFGLVLQHYNYSNDVVFGKVVSGRSYPVSNIEEIVGSLINTVPVRVNCDSNATFKEILDSVQNQAMNSDKYSYCSIVDIQSVLEEKSSLINTALVYENFFENDEIIKLDSDTFLKIIDGREKANFNLSISICEGSSKFYIKAQYKAAMFETETISDLLHVFEFMLRQVINAPDILVNEIKIFDQKPVSHVENRSSRQYEVTFKHIEQFARKSPEKIAVTLGDENITYGELDRKANSIAANLMKYKINKGDIISIIMDKSIESVVCMLAIMKCGGICLTIDPSNPDDRIKYLLSDSGSKFVLVKGKLEYENICTIDINGVDYSSNLNNPNVDVLPTDVAYAIYTSGSTGNPKASLIRYESLDNLFIYLHNKIGLTSKDVVQQFASLSFDASILEIFGALVLGATLAIVPEDIRKDPDSLVEYWNEKRVTYAILPPSMMPFLNINKVKTLKIMMNAGEEAILRYAKQWGEKLTYINGYGPSETTIWTITYVYKSEDNITDKVPIGKPIDNVTAVILHGKQEVLDGMPGELCLGGIAVSNGYLNRDELNKEKFITLPNYNDMIFYRTGDLCKRLKNGNLVFLGRVDKQFKIRGHRIEVGEIERCMSSQLNVDAVVVSIEENKFHNKFIAAYYTGSKEYNLTEVRSILEKKLPLYMIPERIIKVEEIPTTINGKVDKEKLARLKKVTQKEQGALTEEEKCIADIFAEIIQIDTEIIDARYGFLDVGGNSITAIRASHKLKENNLDIGIKDLLKNVSIQELAERCQSVTIETNTEKNNRKQSSFEGVTIENELDSEIYDAMNTKNKGIYTTYKATSMQRFFLKQESVISGHYFEVNGTYSKQEIEEALKLVIEKQGVLRSGIKIENGNTVINEYQYNGTWYFPYHDISLMEDEKKEYILQLERDKFDDNEQFETKVLLSNMVIYKTSQSTHVIILRIHHIFWDARSAEIFEEEVNECLRKKKISDAIRPYDEFTREIVNELEKPQDNLLYPLIRICKDKKNESIVERRRATRSFYNVPIKLSKEMYQTFLKDTWGIIAKIIANVFPEMVNDNELGFTILYHSRDGKNQTYNNTLGLFLDLIPIFVKNSSVESMNQDIMESIKNYKDIKKETSLNFLDFEEKDGTYVPKIIVNYLGEFENNMNPQENKIIKRKLETSSSNYGVIVSLSAQYLNLGMFLSEEEVQEVYRKLIGYFN